MRCWGFCIIGFFVAVASVAGFARAEYDSRLAAWVRLADVQGAMQSMDGKEDRIARVLVSDHCIDQDGVGLTYRIPDGDVRAKEIMAWCRKRNLTVYMGLGNYGGGFSNPQIITAMLKDPRRRFDHIHHILAEVERLGYDGVDLDYENLPASCRQDLTQFVHELSEGLKQGKRGLDITVPPKFSSPGWSKTKAYDWPALSRDVGRVNVMCYDWYIRSGPPGPIIPLGVTKKVIRFIRTLPHPEKYWIGHPAYGNDWVEKKTGQFRGRYDGARAFQEKARQLNKPIRYQADRMGGFDVGPFAHFSYSAADGEHHVWYGDHRSLQATMDETKGSGLGGVFIWRVGFEDEQIWELIPPGPDEKPAAVSSPNGGAYPRASLP